MKITDLAEKFIWSLYSAVAVTVFWIVAMTVCKERHIAMGIGIGAGALLLAAVWLLSFLFRRAVVSKKGGGFQGIVFLPKVPEYLLFAAGLAGVVYVRLFAAASLESNPVYETVRVSSETFRLSVAHNGYRLYLNLLHEVLILIGNKLIAALVFQIVLQTAGIFFLYFAVRRLSGAPAALVTMAFMGFSPYIFMETMQFSVFWFVLFFFGLALWSIACLKESLETVRDSGKVFLLVIDCILTGLLIGFCCYLDVTGLILVVFLSGVVWFSGCSRRRLTAWVTSMIAAFVGFVFFIDLVPGGTENVTSTVSEHLKRIRFRGLLMNGSVQQSLLSWDIAVLAVLLAVGIFGYFYRTEMLDRGMWFFSFAALLAMQCFGVCSREPVNTYAIAYLFCAAMAGCSVMDIFYFKERKLKMTGDGLQADDGLHAEQAQNAEVDFQDLQEGSVDDRTGDDAGMKGEPARTDYIENPLPVPPKHVKKIMDYDYPVADDDDFDIQ